MIGFLSILLTTAAGQTDPVTSVPTHAVKIDLPINQQPPAPTRAPQPPIEVMMLPSAPPPPSPPLPNPSAAARQLAQRLFEGVKFLRQMVVWDIESNLRRPRSSASPGCDFSNTECRRIATEIAEREAPARLTDIIDRLSRILGDHFDKTMTAEQIDQTLQFTGTPAGRAMLQSLFDIDQIDHAQARNMDQFFGGRSDRYALLRREFDDRTHNLPRRVPPTALYPILTPPPPPPPPVPPPPLKPSPR